MLFSTFLAAVLSGSAWASAKRVEICHFDKTAAEYTVLEVAASSVAVHLRHGDSYPAMYYADLDGDGFGDTTGATDVCPNAGYVDDDTDCDDADPYVYPDASEADNGVNDDCDSWVDEDFVLEGDVILTEIVRNQRFGATSAVSDGQWFEVYNASAREVDMSNWYIIRSLSSKYDAFFVDPAAEVIIPAGDFAVFCKTDTYEMSVGAVYPLLCDYVWGDPTRPSTYSSTYHDNTFNLQRDADRLSMYLEGGSLLGRLVDDIDWTWTAGALDNWPRDASYSTSLDPTAFDGVSNDLWSSWCSTAHGVDGNVYTWWVSGSLHEHGTPGTDNYACW